MKKTQTTATRELRFSGEILRNAGIYASTTGDGTLILGCEGRPIPSDFINDEYLCRYIKEFGLSDSDAIGLIEQFYNGLEDKLLMAQLMSARMRSEGF